MYEKERKDSACYPKGPGRVEVGKEKRGKVF
jgi:hypothetical protein